MTFTDPPENVRSLVADIASLREYGVPMGRINALTTGLVSIVEEYESRLGHHKIDQLTGLMTRKTLEEEFSKIQNTDRRSPNQSLVAIVFDIIDTNSIGIVKKPKRKTKPVGCDPFESHTYKKE